MEQEKETQIEEVNPKKSINKKKVLILVLLSMIFIIPFLYGQLVGFVDPTPPDSFFTDSSYQEFNFTIDKTVNQLDNINWTWNNTNFTFMGDDLLFMADYDSNNYSSTEGEGTLTTSRIGGVWHFDEGTGNALDSSQYGGDGVLTSGAAWTSADFKYGGHAIEFDGINDWVDTNAQTAIKGSNNGFTTGAWVYLKGGSDDGIFKLQNIIGNLKYILAGNKYHGYSLGCVLYNDVGETGICRLQVSNGSHTVHSTPFITVNGNEWVHLIGMYNGTDVSIYKNGELTAFAKFNGTYSSDDVEDTHISKASATWNGTLDEVFFVNRPLLEQEVKVLYENQWKNKTHIEGKYNNAYYPFQDSNLSYPVSGNIDNSSGSIEMWFHSSWALTTGLTYLLFDTWEGSNQNRVSLRRGGGTGNLQFVIWDDSSVLRALSGGVGQPFQNQWNHVVATWNETDPKELYLNGVLIDGIVSGSGTGNFAESTMFQIGSNVLGTSARGAIDEVRIYNHTLNQEEVIEHYYGNLKKLNATRWRFYQNRSDLVVSKSYTYQGCATDNIGNLNCTEIRTIDFGLEVSDCIDITTPGSYILGNDIIDSTTSNCINIQTDNVKFNCNNHIIDGTDNKKVVNGININTGTLRGITVRNCKLSDWSTAQIYARNIANITFENIELNSSAGKGYIFTNNFGNLTIINTTVHDISKEAISSRGTGGLILRDSNFYDIYNNAKSPLFLNTVNDLVYNNIINSSRPLSLRGTGRQFNITPTAMTNIIGGDITCGNNWIDPVSGGYSDSCVDVSPNDGICDESYQPDTELTNCIGDDCDGCPLTDFVDNEPPSLVIIYSPRNGSFINGVVEIQADAEDNTGVSNVTFPWKNISANGELCVDFLTPYTCDWDTDDYAEAVRYEINITAYDDWTNTNSSLFVYTIDRSIPIINNVRAIYPGSQTSIKDGDTITLRTGVIDSPMVSAGMNTTQVDLTNFNGTGNTTMIMYAGSLENDMWSNWTIDVEISTGATSISPNAEGSIYAFDKAVPNNIASGYQFNVRIDNTNPTYDNDSYGTIPEDIYDGESVIFYQNNLGDNYDLSGWIFSNNMSGTWQNSSVISINGFTDSSSNTTNVGSSNFSWFGCTLDDAGNTNCSEIRDVVLLGEPPILTIFPLNPLDESTQTSPVNITFNYNVSMADNCTLWMSENELPETENYTWLYPLNSSEQQHEYGFLQDLGSGEYEWRIECIENVTHLPYESIPWTFTVGAVDTCTCAGVDTNWEVNMEDNCVLDTTCDLGTGTLSFINSGFFHCDAQLEYTHLIRNDNGIFWENDSCMRFEG